MSKYKLTEKDVEFKDGVIIEYLNEKEKDIIIPSTLFGERVIELGYESFMCCDLTSIELPKSLIILSDFCLDSNKITKISIPESVTYLAFNCLSNNKLGIIYILNENVEIALFAFDSNPDLKYVMICEYFYGVVSVGRMVLMFDKDKPNKYKDTKCMYYFASTPETPIKLNHCLVYEDDVIWCDTYDELEKEMVKLYGGSES